MEDVQRLNHDDGKNWKDDEEEQEDPSSVGLEVYGPSCEFSSTIGVAEPSLVAVRSQMRQTLLMPVALAWSQGKDKQEGRAQLDFGGVVSGTREDLTHSLFAEYQHPLTASFSVAGVLMCGSLCDLAMISW